MSIPGAEARERVAAYSPPVEVATAAGTAFTQVRMPAGPVSGTVVLTHGAGGGTGSPDLRALTEAALHEGFTVVAVTQPYRVAGRRTPPMPIVQDATWHEILAAVDIVPPLVLAGRSNGARVACRTAGSLGAAAIVALAFPVHPPGRPERHRLAELAEPGCPVMVVQGERDPFGVPGRRRGRRVVTVPGDHALRGAEAVIDREVRALLRRVSREWVSAAGAG